MKKRIIIIISSLLLSEALLVSGLMMSGCRRSTYTDMESAGRLPVIEPDYSGVTIPPNIAPMNFIIRERADNFRITVSYSNGRQFNLSSDNGVVRFPLKAWRKAMSLAAGGDISIKISCRTKENKEITFDTVRIHVARETIDPFICYRLLYSGYESWSEMKIVQRSLSDFNEHPVIENQLLDDNCINCHTFLNNDPSKFFIHVRGSKAGTYFADSGRVTRRELRTQNMIANAVYPSWHPSGAYIAFSSNRILQLIHMLPGKDNEFCDVYSSMLIYDVRKNEMRMCSDTDSAGYMETYPYWSPKGDYLYYCRTRQVSPGFDYEKVRYDLARRPFDAKSGTFGKAETVFDAEAINKSASFPAVSPDNRYIVFTLHDFGTFSVWHKESDLYLLDLETGRATKMNVNSDETESYHAWSSNGRWLLFSSKRDDGHNSRPYFAFFGPAGTTGKPFILPQKDPASYKKMDMTINRPEFVTGRISVGPRDFTRASDKAPAKAVWIENKADKSK